MSIAYFVNVSVHVFAALIWLGGMFFFALVGAPVLRSVEPPALRAQLFRDLGVRFRGVAWVLIVILLTTGTLNLHFRGMLRAEVLGSARFWASGMGQALAWKLAAVAAMLVFSALHDFVMGPRTSRMRPGSAEARRMRRNASWMARANALLGVVVVVAAVALARGGW
jgi:uncharacterized membrane protein